MIVNAIVIICAVASAQNLDEKDAWIEEVNELDRAREPASVALAKSKQRLKLENPSRRANDWPTKHTHHQAEIKPQRLRVVITTHELQVTSSHGKLQAAGLQACRAAYQPHVPKRETFARAPSQSTGYAANIEYSRHGLPVHSFEASHLASMDSIDGDADSSIQPCL